MYTHTTYTYVYTCCIKICIHPHCQLLTATEEGEVKVYYVSLSLYVKVYHVSLYVKVYYVSLSL